jgi:hypothetical protein
MIRTEISVDAYSAVAASSMRMLLEQRGPRLFHLAGPMTLKQLKATKKRSEDLSAVIIRLAKYGR